MNDSTATLVVAGIGVILALIALFVMWRKFGGNLVSDSLPRNVQLVIQQLRIDYEGKLAAMKTAQDAEIAEMKRRHAEEIAEMKRQHAEEIAELQRRITNAEQFTDFLRMQLLAAGGRPMPVTIRQLSENEIPLENQRREMLVAVVDDPGLQMDLAIFRRARIPFIRLRPVTLFSFEVAINRARREGKPFRHIHIAAHTSAEGADFSGEMATPEWLSERMQGVEVLLIAGCESSEIGDWLAGIADYVVTMAEPVSAGTKPSLSDIGIFAEVFWAAVYDGKTASDAFYAAIERSPTWIGEIAEIHAGIRAT